MRPLWRAIRHYLFVGCAGVSLLACVSLAAISIYFWICGVTYEHATGGGRTMRTIGFEGGNFYAFFQKLEPTPVQVESEQLLPTSPVRAKYGRDAEFEFLGLQWSSRGLFSLINSITWYEGRKWLLVVPSPFVIFLFAILPAYGVYRRIRFGPYHRWVKPGFCAKCGYDLRASKERCPECGEAIAESAAVAVVNGIVSNRDE